MHRFDRPHYDLSLRWSERASEFAHAPVVKSVKRPVVHYTPHYLYPPRIPGRVHAFYGAAAAKELKFLAILRNPVDRAVSSYWFKQPQQSGGSPQGMHERFVSELATRRQFEECLEERRNVTSMSFFRGARGGSAGSGTKVATPTTHVRVEEDSTVLGPPRWGGASDDAIRRRDLRCFEQTYPDELEYINHHVNKGVYDEQLNRWFAYFAPENFLVVSLEQFRNHSMATFAQVCAFLGVHVVGPGSFPTRQKLEAQLNKKYNIGMNTRTSPPLPETHSMLVEFYRPHNERLEDMLRRRAMGSGVPKAGLPMQEFEAWR